jgi:hypothetical protein
MESMSEDNYKLYAGNETSCYSTFEGAKEAAKSFIPDKVYLRIEILIDVGPHEADWWAYEYKNNQWVPS